MTRMRSAIDATTARSWLISSNAVPAAFRPASRRRIPACTVTSSAVVGSSAMISSGAAAMAEAMSTRCRSPPDSSWGRCPARSAGSGTRTDSSSSSTRSARCARGTTSWVVSTSAISAPTVLRGSRETSASWRTSPAKPPRSRRQSPGRKRSASLPEIVNADARTRDPGPARPSRLRAVTLFPEPDSPTIATHSPGAIESATPRTTSAAPKLTRRSSTATSGDDETSALVEAGVSPAVGAAGDSTSGGSARVGCAPGPAARAFALWVVVMRAGSFLRSGAGDGGRRP